LISFTVNLTRAFADYLLERWRFFFLGFATNKLVQLLIYFSGFLSFLLTVNGLGLGVLLSDDF